MAEVSTATPSPYNRKNPYLAELIRHERLTKSGSGKDTRHFVLNLAGSGLKYTPGDSLAVFGAILPGSSMIVASPDSILLRPSP